MKENTKNNLLGLAAICMFILAGSVDYILLSWGM